MKDRERGHPVIWFELEVTKDAERNKQSAELANKVLRKLGVKHGQFEWWGNMHNDGGFTYTTAGCYWELPEGGHAFNLEYLASDETE